MKSAGPKYEQPDVQKKVKCKLCIWFLMRLHKLSWRRGAHTPSLHEWPRWSFARRAIPVIISRGTSGWPGTASPQHSQVPDHHHDGAVSNWGSYRAPLPSVQTTTDTTDHHRDATGSLTSPRAHSQSTVTSDEPIPKVLLFLSLWFLPLGLMCWLHMVLISQPFSDDAMRLNDMAIVTKGWQH